MFIPLYVPTIKKRKGVKFKRILSLDLKTSDISIKTKKYERNIAMK